MNKKPIEYSRRYKYYEKNVGEYQELEEGLGEEEGWKSVLEQLRYSSSLAFQKS